MICADHTGLRAIRRDDLPQLLDWRNDPRLRRYFREVRELSPEHQQNWFERCVLGGDHQVRMFAIVRLDTGALIGACGLTGIDWLRRHGELSLYIGTDAVYCDHTHAPEAVRLLLGHGFGDLGLNRIHAEVYAFDDGKTALLRRTGLIEEGCLRDHHWSGGRYWDAHLFGILAREWSLSRTGTGTGNTASTQAATPARAAPPPSFALNAA